ncbi:MAG: MBL fold metallo-hydrolase [Porticoccaceae bacterium]
MKFKIRCIVSALLLTTSFLTYAEPCCGTTGVCVQVLGSGGPEVADKRASSGYLVWQDGRARIMIDMGPGSMLRYEESGARVEDLEVVLLSHLHVDHSADLPALIKGAFFTDRTSDLPLYGPSGNALIPDATAFVQTLFANPTGAYHYLSGYLAGEGAYRLQPHDVPVSGTAVQQVLASKDFNITAVAVHHGPLPALAWRIDIGGRAIVFSGDMNGDKHTLPKLAAEADLLVAHHAVPQEAKGVARKLHMPPSVIGEIAAEAKVKQLVLSHRMSRTLGREKASEIEIRKRYAGPLEFADDGQCFNVSEKDQTVKSLL